MIRGLYTGASGMLAQLDRYDVIANNLANVSTPGYKRQEAIVEAFPTMLMYRVRDARDDQPMAIGRVGTGALLSETVTRFDAGTLEQTDNPLDMAISGDGYFAVATPRGVRYTRNGSFRADGNGRLVTMEGDAVLGSDGAPVSVVGFDPAKVRVVRVPAGDLVKEGDNLFRLRDGAPEPTAAADAKVLSGRLETSNVNPVTAMIDMLSALRAYEANQKVIQAMDDTLGKAVNEIAR